MSDQPSEQHETIEGPCSPRLKSRCYLTMAAWR